MTIAENISLAKENIAAAARRAGRSPGEIYLVGATKMNDTPRVREAIAAGLPICGENRVQELLQKNKVRQIVGLVSLIHSVDSVELMAQIDRTAGSRGIVQDILLEVNIGAEAAKSGFSSGDIPAALAAAAQFPALRVRGLMAVPPICADGEENRPYFEAMKQLFIDNSEKKYDNVVMDFLSMGMSGDYMTAIDCGANMVRLGTAIFGPRNYNT